MLAFKQISTGFNLFRLSLLLIRMCFIIPPALFLMFYHNFLSKLLFVDIVKRYVTCITNLILIRWILIVLGFIRFENDSFKFFTRSYNDKFTLRSGYIGIANHHNIIDFLFYSYIMSPTYVKILIVNHSNGNKDYMYIPLTFMEAFECALTARGFEPTVIEQKELNKIKERKLSMNLLVVETFENLKGPILVLLPGLDPQKFIPIDQKLIEVINFNENKFNRWTVGLRTQTPNIKHIYLNQMDLIFDLLQKFSVNQLKIQSCQFHKTVNYQMNFSQKISSFMTNGNQNKIHNISYQNYIKEFNLMQKQQRNKNQSKDYNQPKSQSQSNQDLKQQQSHQQIDKIKSQ